jgi:hypothetical protein
MVLLDMNYNTLNTKVRADSILLLETKHWENTAGQASPSLCYVFEAGSLAACNAHRGANQSTPRGLCWVSTTSTEGGLKHLHRGDNASAEIQIPRMG